MGKVASGPGGVGAGGVSGVAGAASGDAGAGAGGGAAGGVGAGCDAWAIRVDPWRMCNVLCALAVLLVVTRSAVNPVHT